LHQKLAVSAIALSRLLFFAWPLYLSPVGTFIVPSREIRRKLKSNFLNNQISPEGKKSSTEKPCSSSFEWYCSFVSPKTSSGCNNRIKFALFAWPLSGHKHDFGSKHFFRH
jgi:hypothetical protein